MLQEHINHMSPSKLDRIPQQDLDDENVCGEETRDAEQEIRIGEKKDLNPQVGMGFDSLDEVKKFYNNYASNHGFDIVVRTSKKKGNGNDVNIRYHTFICDRGGKSRRTSKNIMIPQSSKKTECKAKMNVKEFEDGRVVLLKVNLEHNHELCPGQTKNLKTHKKINFGLKRIVELNDEVGNLRLGEGEVESIKVLIQMQDENPNNDKNSNDKVGGTEKERYDVLCNRFRNIAAIGAKTVDNFKLLMEFLDHAEEKIQMEKEVCDGEYESNNLSNMVESNNKVQTKGCPRSKRKHFKEEERLRIKKKKDLDDGNICYEQIRNDEQEIAIGEKEEALNPQVGMGFGSLDEAKKFYKNYRYHTIACDRGGLPP